MIDMFMGLLRSFSRFAHAGWGMIFHNRYNDAQAYETIVRTFSGRGLLARHIADIMGQYVRSDAHSHILDLASGTGIIACELAKRGYKVCASDINPTMLEHLRLTAPQIERVVCDFNQKLPFKDDYFDAVTSVWANRYITKDGLYIYLEEVRRVLKPGGVFLWPIFPAETIMWKIRNGAGQITGPDSLSKIIQDMGYSEAFLLRDLFYKNMFSFKLPPYTIPVYIIARK